MAAYGEDQGPTIKQLTTFFEIGFLITLITRFFTDYTINGETEPVRDLAKISKRYFFSFSFVIDFVPQIPFQDFFRGESAGPDSYVKLFYLIKIIRMIKGLGVFNVQEIHSNMKQRVIDSNKKRIKADGNWGEDKIQDKNQVDNLLMMMYGLKVFKLVLVIVNISFYMGIIWMIFCDLNEKLSNDSKQEYFLDYFHLRDTTRAY